MKKEEESNRNKISNLYMYQNESKRIKSKRIEKVGRKNLEYLIF